MHTHPLLLQTCTPSPMKFGQLLKALAIPEWRLCYLSYNLLKEFIDLIKRAVHLKQRGTISSSDLSLLDDITVHANKNFFVFYKEEIFLVFAFVQCKVIELSDREASFEILIDTVEAGNELFLNSIENLYIEVSYLSNLIRVNIEGERKILKKHKKTMKKVGLPSPKMLGEVITRQQSTVSDLKDGVEDIYVNKSMLESKESRTNIRDLVNVESKNALASFFFGMGVGTAFSIIGIMIGLLAFQRIVIDTDLYFVRDFPVFRGLGLLLVYLWLFALDIYTFEKVHINYKLIFGMISSETSVQIFYRNSILTAIYLILFLVWVIGRVTEIQSSMIYLGGAAWGSVLIYFFMPAPALNWRGRLFMLKLIGRALISPIFGVDFPITWLTDQMVSLITSWKDLAYTICYYSALDLGPNAKITQKNICNASANIYVVFFVGMFVYLYRTLQCIRQGIGAGTYFFTPFFYNTLKYLFSLLTLTLSFTYNAYSSDILFPLWCVSSIISTLYSYLWDLKMDWGLLDKNAKHRFLREDLVYGSPAFYYIIMVANFFLRLSWVLTFSPSIVAAFNVKPIVFTLIVGSLEIIRRSLWNLLRVEKEHIANCTALKAIVQDQTMKLLKVEQESSARLNLSEALFREVKDERVSQLKKHLFRLIERKKERVAELEKFVANNNRVLDEIHKRSKN